MFPPTRTGRRYRKRFDECYSLAAETIVQILVPVSQRIEFSGVEMGFVSAAEVAR